MSGDGAKVAYPLFQEEDGGSSPTSPLQFRIVEIHVSKAQELNALWHSRLPIYNTGFCLNSAISFAAIYENKIYAVAIWSNPVACNCPQKEWLELRRMAICSDAPKNTASRMLSVMVKVIRKKFHHVTKLISYQDTEVHTGTIYKASGWIKGKEHKGGSWNRPNAHNSWNLKKRTRPDLNEATGPKIRWEKDL